VNKFTEPDDVSQVSAHRVGNPTPQPSVVRWIGPPPDSLDAANLAQSFSIPSVPATNPSATFAETNPLAHPVPEVDQSIPKVEQPPIAAATRPVLAEAGTQPAKIVENSGHPAVVQAPVAVVKPATMPSDHAAPEVIAKANDTAINITHETSKAAVAIVAPATKPTESDVATDVPKSVMEAVNPAPMRLLKAVSFESVLEQLPPDARPLPKAGWDEFAIAKSIKWINRQLAGAEMQVVVEIEGVNLNRIPDANNPVETAGWEIVLTTNPESFRTFDIDTFHWPATWMEDAAGKRWRGGDVRISVTEDVAKQARLWRAGDTIVLSGRVQGVAIEGGMTNLGQPCGRFTTIFSDVHIDKFIPQSGRP
jgi:hypothetical protein